MQKMCILRALRPDKMSEAIQNYVCEYLHPKFIQPPPFDLPATYNDSTCTTPLIFILSSGCDPGKDLITFADSLGFGERFSSIALGQGQGKIAARMIENGRKKGDWALLQNCHLSQSWMPELEVIVESFSVDTVHNDFRLWLTSMPTPFFPVTIMQNSVKMTKEPPKGIRANLKQTYFKLDDDQLGITTKPDIYKHLLFGLSFFHAVMIERKKFGPLGWNIPYAFNDTDFDICKSQLALYLDVYDEVPWAVLKVLTAVVNYGGRITDDKDIRTADIILETFFNPAVLEQGYKFSQSGLYGSVEFNKDAPYKSYWDYVEGLPINPEPEAFGMHDNANITCARAETYSTFQIILSLQPRVASGGGKSREEQIGDAAGNIEKDLPSTYNIPAIQMQYPVRYDESMNTVLVQELQKFNRLLRIVQKTLKDIQLALKGLVVMSGELEQMGTEMFNQLVPSMWMAVSYPSLKPLSAYVIDMLKRLAFMQTWVDEDMPNVYWISCFFFPQAFMTGTLQNYARKTKYPIDECEFAHIFVKEDKDEVAAKPSDGAYMDGLFIEGARWSKIKSGLDDPLPKELFSTMPIIHLSPLKGKTRPTHAIYQTPVYKTLTRAGVLATTGHSSNFVFWMEVPSDRKDCMRQSLCSETNANVLFTDQADWVKGGVACFCALRF
jgi:dynein heavy chain